MRCNQTLDVGRYGQGRHAPVPDIPAIMACRAARRKAATDLAYAVFMRSAVLFALVFAYLVAGGWMTWTW